MQGRSLVEKGFKALLFGTSGVLGLNTPQLTRDLPKGYEHVRVIVSIVLLVGASWELMPLGQERYEWWLGVAVGILVGCVGILAPELSSKIVWEGSMPWIAVGLAVGGVLSALKALQVRRSSGLAGALDQLRQ